MKQKTAKIQVYYMHGTNKRECLVTYRGKVIMRLPSFTMLDYVDVRKGLYILGFTQAVGIQENIIGGNNTFKWHNIHLD